MSSVEPTLGASPRLNLAVQLDGLLFDPDGWFCIDAANQRVRGVRPANLTQALSLVGQGRVASVVGRLREGVVAVDIDVAGVVGDAVLEHLVAWATRSGAWHVHRESGGGWGRAHFITIAGGNIDALTALVHGLRETHGATAREIDVRSALRPLSAPHRSGRPTHPPLISSPLLEEARRLLQGVSGPPVNGAPEVRSTSRRRPARRLPGEALVPSWRPRRGLPGEWQGWLDTGRLPETAITRGYSADRSNLDAVATGHLVRAGHTAESAWQVIRAAHPKAMVRARASRRRWVRHVWNPAVRADQAWIVAHKSGALARRDEGPRSGSADVSLEIVDAVGAARQEMTDLMWKLSPRRRAALLRVGDAVLDRMLRVEMLRVPCPERDLVLDTGITTRAVIRHALRDLHRLGLLVLHRSFDPRQKATTSFEIELPDSGEDGAGETYPPLLHTPRVPAGVWAGLPGGCYLLWRALRRLGAAAVKDLTMAAGVTASPTSAPTVSEVRTATANLLKLARAGLAVCDATGRWTVSSDLDESTHRRAERHYHESVAVVVLERIVYRACAWVRPGGRHTFAPTVAGQSQPSIRQNRRRANQRCLSATELAGLGGSEGIHPADSVVLL